MTTEQRNFDQEASRWDEHPARVKLASDVAKAIAEHVGLTPDMDVLDFGCGTGLLSFQLLNSVRSIHGVDSSRGMLEIFNAKLAQRSPANATSQLFDPDRGTVLSGHYQLITSSMTLHHIKEIAPLFAQFHHILNPSGHLCIADLDLDDGQFHEDNTGVFHFGFDRTALRKVFQEAGFANIRDMTAAEVIKPDARGTMRTFTVFLMTGEKKPRTEDDAPDAE